MPPRTNSLEPEALLPRVKTDVRTIIGWPTETVHVFHGNGGAELEELPRVILVFVPGNPGCIGWYTPLLIELVTKFGSGFAARGLSYAGHSGSDDLTNVEQWHNSKNSSMERDSAIPWTIEGQVLHKITFIDTVLSEWNDLREKHEQKNPVSSNAPSLPRFVFLAHSIGAHMVQRLCILRPDILQQTDLLVQLMPYTRMKAPRFQQKLLNLGASYPNILIGLGKTVTSLLKAMPYQTVDSLMKSTVEDQEGRTLAVRLARQPTFGRNFFELGTEEIRDVPEEVDYFALRCIGKQCPTAMLYCGEDHWAPEFHQDDLNELQRRHLIPQNIHVTYIPDVRHDFVSHDFMVQLVLNWCLESIRNSLGLTMSPARSRL